MLEGASPLNPIYIIKARRASDFIIYYFFFILFVEQELDKLFFVYQKKRCPEGHLNLLFG